MTNNRQIEWILFIAIILFFVPYLSLGFTTNDDAFNQVYHSWNEFKDGAFKQGRIQFFLFHWLVIKLSFLIDSIFFIKLISTLSILINIFYFAYFLEKITAQKYFGYLFIIVFVTFLQDSWDHFLLTASPLIYTVGFSLFLASLHLYISENVTKQKLMISAALFVLTLQISEMFLLFSLFYPLFSRIYLNKSIFHNVKYHIIFSAIYIAIYIGFRVFYGTDYAGNTVGEFSVLDSLKTVCIYSLYTFPASLFLSTSIMGVGDLNEFLNYPFDFNLSGNPVSKFKYNIKIIFFNIDEINVLWIIKYLFFVIVAFESLKNIKKIDKKIIILLIISSILLLFLPNILHSVTNKYQQWALLGNSKGYVGTYISYFGMTLLLTFGLILLKTLGWFDRPTFLSKFGLSIIILFLFFVSTFVSITNEAIFNHKKQSHYRWELMDKFFKTEAFKDLKEGSRIYALGLTDIIGIVDKYKPTPNERSDYWDRYILMKTGKKIELYEGYPEKVDADNYYVLKIIQPKNDYDTFAIFAKIKKDTELISNFYLLAKAKKTNVLSYETLDGFKSLPFRLKDEKDFLLIKENNVSLNSIWVDYPVRNRKENTIFAKPMLKGSIYTDRFEYSFSTNFYTEESSGMNTWHWSQKQSQLIINNKAKDPITVTLKFIVSTGQEKESEILIYIDEKAKNSIKARDKDKDFSLSFNLKSGENIINFQADESAKFSAGVDARNLYFQVKNLIITEVR